VLSEEIIVLLPRFVDQRGPTHDELTRMIDRAGLRGVDPHGTDSNTGKVKRIRAILAHAIDREPKKGEHFVKGFINQVRACGGFRIGSDQCPGAETVTALRSALRHMGFDLDAEGYVRPTLLENLEGAELTEALWSYVRRAQTGAGDSELVIGTAKNLEEATVRHVLKQLSGSYATTGHTSHFPVALYQAFDRLGLSGSTSTMDSDPYKALQQGLFLVACAVNRLRNDRGDGHGRPGDTLATMLEGRLSSQAAGLVSELLLSALDDRLPR
jgi:hypothetical protein